MARLSEVWTVAASWYGAAARLRQAVTAHNLGLLSAAVAFYGMLALFPGIAAAISVLGLAIDPETVTAQATAVQNLLPAEAWRLLAGQLQAVSRNTNTSLTTAFVISAALSLYSSGRGAATLIQALNVIHETDERRHWLAVNLVALSLTLGGILFFGAALLAIVVLPLALQLVGLGWAVEVTVATLRWPLLAAAAVAALTALYRYGPSARRPRRPIVSRGALLAVGLWLAASGAFSWYVAHFASYNETYGALGAAVILLMWLWISAYAVLLGAEFDRAFVL